MRTLYLFLTLILAIRSLVGLAETRELKHIFLISHIDDYAVAQLKWALSSESNTKYLLTEYIGNISYGRIGKELSNGKLDVIWSTQNEHLESSALRVNSPLFEGIFGHRVIVTSPANSPILEKAKTLGDIRHLTVGLGVNWPDTTILKSAGLKVMTGIGADSLYKMLAAERFDLY